MRARRGESFAKPFSDDPFAEKAEKLAKRCVCVRFLPGKIQITRKRLSKSF
jgi:hypothetical protein